MANDYVEYLSENVLNDGQTVSYRTLSRALRVHNNVAKQMLYQFHHSQNEKQSNSLDATYLINGLQTIVPKQAEDTATESQSESQETHAYQATCLLLVDEHELDRQSKSTWRCLGGFAETPLSTKSCQYTSTASSLARSMCISRSYKPTPNLVADFEQDLHVLTECNRAIMATAAKEDLLETYKQYGVIQNGQVKRRAMRTQQHSKQASAQKPEPLVSATKSAKPMFASARPTASDAPNKTTTSNESTPASSQPSQTSAKPAATKPATLKREGSSLFKAFAKAKPKKTQSQTTESSAEPTPTAEPVETEDEAMHDLSDEEADDEDTAMLDEGAITETGGKSKKEREDELRRMMDMEDAPMAEAPNKTIAAEDSGAAQDESDVQLQATEEPVETVTVSDGRRRGRRRVMKKKTVQDEEGYLVTREEPGWESFSEEEPAPKKAKLASAPAAAKTKKAAPKGQGNIMSFFSKK
ncbi:hypothetical protein E4T38_00775 [Aureobasidium subglaciale]|nr:hypothetical protein E4T38_00775 [Aureobasidium subglaciale]KAI5231151.1 hypothetical protein E4T40_00776 [Aureobasidium subglaciale]KAI5234245.1 hypothetical protein E4T41_00774 [Aureobasidium subglaciale]KAI5267594.1 hypothetical protein E4T46_00774 [Aureobasidium subglaciale]